ncbi:hypothetical protein ASPBRDRAFT_113408 [Aspergillus brasiliensis CBS 101740]|uniref:Aminoglycoside phosphotransferase domain-containing protein n=1 Tax=Aspergillus brasiliensis (strain CBS 101740 / IMI 381727 / IBT 21946) TaxID=767769 RepID=A0A1L9V221_ASPBC|nr:hypothetical protein ASPBRDRAFT_113408 [Aspergillus brasiliensis CBS 101740]
MWSFSFRDRVFDIENEYFKVVKQLTEDNDVGLGERKVLAVAKRLDKTYLLKIRYQLDPEDCDLEDPDEILKVAEQSYCHEVEAIDLLSTHGYGPKYHNHETQKQPAWMPFPGGYLEFIVMEFPPGENVDDIQDELTDSQRKSIRTQLAQMLELMRKNDYKLTEQHPSYLHYDARADRLYLMDLAGLGYTNSATSYPIDEESPYVTAFNLWWKEYLRSKRDPESSEIPVSPQPIKMPHQPNKKENKPPRKA